MEKQVHGVQTPDHSPNNTMLATPDFLVKQSEKEDDEIHSAEKDEEEKQYHSASDIDKNEEKNQMDENE